MFSGIIDQIGEVRACTDAPGGRGLTVAARGYWAGVEAGASIAIDGVCLTMTAKHGDDAAFDVIAETLRRTTLGELRRGARVNLQKSLAVGARIDGHFVQGHVDLVATVLDVQRTPRDSVWWFSVDEPSRPCLVPKGSVAIDGISLTIAEVRPDRFGVALIPTTLERTTLGSKVTGSRVNVETDILARAAVNYLRTQGFGGGLDLETLKRHGLA